MISVPSEGWGLHKGFGEIATALQSPSRRLTETECRTNSDKKMPRCPIEESCTHCGRGGWSMVRHALADHYDAMDSSFGVAVVGPFSSYELALAALNASAIKSGENWHVNSGGRFTCSCYKRKDDFEHMVQFGVRLSSSMSSKVSSTTDVPTSASALFERRESVGLGLGSVPKVTVFSCPAVARIYTIADGSLWYETASIHTHVLKPSTDLSVTESAAQQVKGALIHCLLSTRDKRSYLAIECKHDYEASYEL